MSHLLTLDSVGEKKEEELSFSFWNWWNYFFWKFICGVRFDQCDPGKFISSFPFIDKSFWIMRLNKV